MLDFSIRQFATTAAVGAALALTSLTATAQESDLPLIKVVATGGTIANTPDGRLSVDAVIEALPVVESLAELQTEEVTRVGSSTLGWQEFIDTAKAIERSLEEEPEIDGYVVTIGSNTSGDMAYFLNLVLDTEKPIVVTAAQRQRTTLSEDASRNFVDAVITAGTPESTGKGVLLVANELIHSGRDVVKQVVSRVDSWQSLDVGALGIVSGGEAAFYRTPTRRHTTESEFNLDEIESAEDLPKVEILYSYVDANPVLIEALVADGTDGIVVAAFATGSAHAGQRPPLSAAMEQGVKVAIANRGSNGRFTVEGGDYYDLSADNLAPQKALILMMMGLTVTDDSAELRRIFSEY
ncbi:asparaginase [Palleronia sp. LCG004]|uniref:asparaginase n=1 Tax=Palleronia sp. LCG004 TaxID=3079304 RepID=UPI002941C298|nr:asparaginase [Palleronia sp. LCG004]WOI57960.1 asparaginase [Palleronia sp. LCG004]